MQVLITGSSAARTRVLNVTRLQLASAVVLICALLLLLSALTYHLVFLKAAREGWPVVSQLVQWVVREEMAQRDRFMRENLDAIAAKVGEMQARLVKLQVIGERVRGMAGLKAEDLPPRRDAAAPGGRGGPFLPLAAAPSLAQLQAHVAGLDEAATDEGDVLTLIESRLSEARLLALMVPSIAPVDGPVGSGFGFRADPFNGRAALHTGLDFPAESGTPARAAAGGVVQSTEWHPEYGQLVVLDHGNGLVTRYAHLSQALVATGDIVRRGQTIGRVGTSGRSTGPHLHFEVLLEGVPQNPTRFLAGAAQSPAAPRRPPG